MKFACVATVNATLIVFTIIIIYLFEKHERVKKVRDDMSRVLGHFQSAKTAGDKTKVEDKNNVEDKSKADDKYRVSTLTQIVGSCFCVTVFLKYRNAGKFSSLIFSALSNSMAKSRYFNISLKA